MPDEKQKNISKNETARTATEKSEETNSRYVSCLAKLITSHGFARGDFLTLQYATVELKNVAIGSASVSDRGKIYPEGTFFTLTNFPSDKEIYTNSVKMNSALIRGKMIAYPVLTEKDKIDETNSIPSTSLIKQVAGIATAFLLDTGKSIANTSSTCYKAPTSLTQAVARARGVSTSTPGNGYKQLPPNAETVTTQDGRVVMGSIHTEYAADGSYAVLANNRGFSVDKNGDMDIQSKNITFRESPGEPSGLAGIPTRKNNLRDMNPGTFIFPAGMGPLALNRIPDLTILNWLLKIIQVSNVIKDIKKMIDDSDPDAKKKDISSKIG